MIGLFDYKDVETYPNGSVIENNTELKVLELSTIIPGNIVEIECQTNKIVKLIKCITKYISGILNCAGPVMGIIKKGIVYRRFIPFNKNMPHILVSCKKPQNCPDEYGIVNITHIKNYTLYGEYINKLGYIGDINTEKEYLLYNNNVKRKKYSSKLNLDEYLNDLTPDRVDLTQLYTVSVDPDNCTDIDDAISCIEEDTIYKLYIHIADVSSFINNNTELDIEGLNRTESLYLNWGQENMYPDKLVQQMSLFENSIRRSYTVEIHIDKKMLSVLSITCYKANINVIKNMTYDEFNSEYKSKRELELMYNVGKRLYESKSVLKNTSVNYDSHKMIEVFMILCNSCVAKKIIEIGKYVPISRIHTELSYDDTIEIIKHYKSLRATYILGEGSHDSIGQMTYCHFTSPIRRYVDVLTHRILYASINNTDTCIDKLTNKIIQINYMQQKIKKVNRDSHILMKIYDYYVKGQTVLDTNGTVVDIRENSIIVYSKEYDLDVKCILYSYKIKHLLSIEHTDDYIVLRKNDTDIRIDICDQIKIKIVITFLTPNLSNKIKGQIIEPNIGNLFNDNDINE